MSLEQIIKRNHTVTLIFFIASFFVWSNYETFLWRDDWIYLLLFQNNPYSFFSGHIASDIKPLFQYLLFPQFSLFTNHFYLYQLVNVIFLATCATLFFHILISFQISRIWALFGSMLYLLHPTNFVNASWIFQQCELAHILLLLICLLAYKSHSASSGRISLLVYTIAMLLQNYFFPNGVFYPIMFIALPFLLQRNWKLRHHFIIANILVLSIHLIHVSYVQLLLEKNSVPIAGIFEDIPQKMNFFISFTSNSLGRLFIPNLKFLPKSAMNWILVFAFLLTILLIAGKSKHIDLLKVALAGTFFSAAILTFTRYNIQTIPYYYSSLQLPFLLMAVVGLAQGITARIPHILLSALASILFLVLIFFDVKGKKIFSDRNVANKAQMEKSLMLHLPYNPHDDPAIEIDNYISLDGESSNQTAVILYQELIK